MNAETRLQLLIGAQAMRIAVLEAEVERLQAVEKAAAEKEK